MYYSLIIDEQNNHVKESLSQKSNEYLNRVLEINKYLNQKKEDFVPDGVAEESKSSEEKKYYRVIL